MNRKMKTYAEKSIVAYILPGESNEVARQRLAALWAQGKHPVQLEEKEKDDAF